MSVDVEYIILMYLFICKLLSYPKCAFDELNVHCVFQTTDRKKFCSKFLSSVVTPNRINRDRIFTQKKPNLVLLCVNKLNKCRLTFFLYCGLFTFTVRYSLQTEHCQSKALTGEPKPKSFPCSLHTKSTFDFLSDIVTNYATALCVCVFVVFWGSPVHSMHLYVSQWKSYCSQREMQWLKNFFHFTI